MKKQPFTRQYANPLKRGGLSRPERPNADLRPETAQVDGRSLRELLHFWYEYARQINYYGSNPEVEEGDWLPFFRRSIPFQYAQIAAHDLDAIERRFTALRGSIDSRLTFASLNALFDLLFEMADRLAQWKANLSNDQAGLRATLDGLVETNLREWTTRLIGLANAAGKWGYHSQLALNTLQKEFGIGLSQSFAVDRSILRLRGSLKHKVLAARDILEEIYRVFWKATEAVVQTAQREEILERSLRNEATAADYSAHLGLMFSFLLLFKELQGSLNRLSTSHLKFFYGQTLRLDKLPARNDRAHLVFSLGKQVREAILVEQGTRFKAGKDAVGADVFFELPADHIVTQTQVGDLRSLYIDQGRTGSLSPDRLYGVHAAPVANSADGVGGPFPKGEAQTWPTVGAARHRAVDPETGEPKDDVAFPMARLGWLVAGKVLFLREGVRTIDIEITLDNNSLSEYGYPAAGVPLFKLYLSTEEGWMLAPEQPVWTLSGDKLAAALKLAADFPPVVFPAEAEKFGMDRFGTTSPLLKAELDHTVVTQRNRETVVEEDGEAMLSVAAETVSWYYALRTQSFSNISIEVQVCDLRQIVVQNDLAVLDANKPFMPFGPVPKKNSSKFYFGSEELYCKEWEQVDVTLVWKDKPVFATHYQGYSSAPPEGLAVKATLLSGKDFVPTNGLSKKLFQDDPISVPEDDQIPPWLCNKMVAEGQTVSRMSFSATSFEPPVAGPPGLDLSGGYTQDLPSGFFRLQLGAQDFLHDQYAEVLIAAALEMQNVPELKNQIDLLKSGLDITTVGGICSSNFATRSSNVNRFNVAKGRAGTLANLIDSLTDNSGNIIVPEAPYTPLLESIRLDYRATDKYAEGGLELWHLHPWEGTFEKIVEVTVTDPESEEEIEQLQPDTLLPCFLDEGTLYLGLDNYQPGELLNLYFQLDPATADPTVDKAIVCWEYLRGNSWYPLRPDAEVLSDTTQDLIRPGIVTLSVPTKISSVDTTILPADRYWIKARVALRTAAICESVRVATQAAEVVYAPAEANDPRRLASPLVSGGIAKLAAPVNGIKGVEQPAASFGGRAPELDPDYYGRVSERLRHKDRAISIDDYERLVLAEFPQVYRVKCLNHTLGRRGEARDYELSPGFVTLVVVPDLSRLSAPDIYRPKVPAADLQAIKDFLAERTTPFVRLEVLNPIYQPIQVSATVRFRAGKSPTFYQDQLQQDLRTFIAPWSGAQPGADINFGGGLYYSTVVRFVEELPYVAHVLDLGLLDVGSATTDEPQERIEARTARTVLTTSEMHALTPDESDFATALTANTGIEFDFKILT